MSQDSTNESQRRTQETDDLVPSTPTSESRMKSNRDTSTRSNWGNRIARSAIVLVALIGVSGFLMFIAGSIYFMVHPHLTRSTRYAWPVWVGLVVFLLAIPLVALLAWLSGMFHMPYGEGVSAKWQGHGVRGARAREADIEACAGSSDDASDRDLVSSPPKPAAMMPNRDIANADENDTEGVYPLPGTSVNESVGTSAGIDANVSPSVTIEQEDIIVNVVPVTSLKRESLHELAASPSTDPSLVDSAQTTVLDSLEPTPVEGNSDSASALEEDSAILGLISPELDNGIIPEPEIVVISNEADSEQEQEGIEQKPSASELEPERESADEAEQEAQKIWYSIPEIRIDTQFCD
ncbi:hypothetical protein DL93DRAFT_2082433 [Clavulina sp. PMI_390]|nr:hypothetical protein DL93DRAFT_2082433 [Clavulina sp. PMI_390]